MADDFVADIRAMVEEHGGFENLLEIRTVMEDGSTITTTADVVGEGAIAFGDPPELARESTFIFRGGNPMTVKWGE